MDIQRAQEIAESPTMADVTYNGVSVYIQHIDQEKELARIYPLDQPEEEQEVPVRSLVDRSAMLVMEVEQMSCRELE
ncbi:small acid-soluble spore protein H [Paenibacillus sp. GCM10023252]|uniref:small acid-soluble spore protein H n=1 Tax=Paenibacillus sp. GCM10023252 TaxID=3252649 RepID=UPI00361979EB